MNEPDGINEALGNAMAKAITVGTEVARTVALLLERQARQAQRLHEEAYKRYVQDARSALRDVSDSRWWDRATPDEIGRAWEVARACRGIEELDVDARKAESRIRRELDERYGIDPENTGLDPASVSDLVAQRIDEVQRARPQATEPERAPAQMSTKQSWHIERVVDQALTEEWAKRGSDWWLESRSDQRLRAWKIAQDFAGDERADLASKRILELAEKHGGPSITTATPGNKAKAVRAHLEALVRADPVLSDAQRAAVLARRNFAKKARASVERQPAAAARPPAHSRGKPPVKAPTEKRHLGDAATIG
jgi:hypothetical protein